MAQSACAAAFEDDFAMYKDERRALYEGQLQAHRDSDKWLLGVAGGALALSMTFMTDVVPATEMRAKYILFFAWTTLVVTVAATVASLQCSAKAWEAHRQVLDEAFCEYSPDVWARVRQLQERTRWNSCVEALNWIALGALLLGLIGIGVFLAANLI